MEIELGHTNYQLGELGKDGVRLTSISPEPHSLGVAVSDLTRYQELADADKGEGSDVTVHFHTDSYPFVCVLMLSDVTVSQGGGFSAEHF